MTTFRGALRAAAAAAIVAADTIASDNVQIEYDWAAPSAQPMISVTVRRSRYDDRTNGTGVPQFWSRVVVGVECRVSQPDANSTGRAALVDQLDTLSDQVDAVMAGFIIGPPQLFRRIVSVDAEMELSAQGELHQGELNLGYVFEYDSQATPVLTDMLEQVALYYVKKLRFGGRFGGRFQTVLASFLTNIPQS